MLGEPIVPVIPQVPVGAGNNFNTPITQVAAGHYLTLQPNPGKQYIVHNIFYSGGPLELHYTDGTTDIIVSSDTAAGSWMGIQLHFSNLYYYRVLNSGSTAINIAADGIYTQ
jgi:hypothetical protein